jgi:hypothetical protein
MTHPRDNRLTVCILALLVLLLVLLSGCGTDKRDAAIANSAATIWEAAQAIRIGAPPEAPARAIQENAAAIIKASGATYQPAEAMSKP